MNEHWIWYPWGMGISMFFMLLLWILAIVGIVFLVRWVLDQTTARQRGRSEDSALDILNKRYARGEINREEYEEKKKDLL
ncbi:MAG: SHOCT domain-containing protein [Candidatus Binatia bacterium]